MIRCLTREKRGKRGFTMMEVLVVVGIIAVIAAIAIPSVISMRKNMDYKQRCDYAKTIFLAAQSNLADLRSTGELKLVEDASNSHGAVLQQEDAEKAETEEGGTTGNLPGGFVSRYIYTANSGGTADDRYAQVLPVNAVESTIRDQNVIIEYNPRTGIVHAVFYAEGNYDLLGNYQKGMLKRDEQWLKENLVGYYSMGNADISEELGFKTVSPEIEFTNGQEAILTVKIPTRTTESTDKVFFEPSQYGYYVKGLEINLTVVGENSGVFTMNLKKSGEEMHFEGFDEVEGAALVIPLQFTLDSLAEGKGFYDIPENKDGEDYHVLPGDNISLFVEVSYVPTSQNDPLIMYDDAVLAGVNPLFHAVTGEASNYTVAISNGRHLQNLNALHSDIAGSVKTITFLGETKSEATEDGESEETTSAPIVDWADTVRYYQQNHAKENLKYFVPIENNGLFNRGTENSLLIKGDNIKGDNAEIRNLKISDATPEKYVGLFRTLNGVNLENLRIVDPVIRGGDAAKAQKGVGILAGSIQNSEVTNCYVYVDVSPADFNWSHLDMGDGFGSNNTTEQHYGVVGCTAVGGMVGYSNNTTFTESFAAVPVCGDMHGAKGSTVGVGGFVGAADGGSFTKCYTSVRTVGASAIADGAFSSSCGLGGFVGTSDCAKFFNCFASGNVTHKAGSLASSGGFVGIAYDDAAHGNGLFNSCYALGTVSRNDGVAERYAKFVGKTYGRNIAVEEQDYYKALLKYSNPGYIFRDCYYLQGKAGILNGDDYTLPASFDMLYSMYNLTHTDEYLKYVCASLDLLEDKKYEELDKATLNKIGGSFADSGFGSKHRAWMHGLESEQYKKHYPYNEGYMKHEANYPYSMLRDMPFYGIWPDAPSEVGIAYVEIYADETRGFYYDEMDKMSLQDKTVIADGYVILSANNGTVEVKLNDTDEIYIPLVFSTTIGRNEYYYGFIPVNQIPATNNFYTKVEIKDTQVGGEYKEYTMYFNPNVAGSQLNPSGTKTEANNPGNSVPSTIYIHSARQLNALASDKMKPFWGADYTLVGTIDFDRYGLDDTELAAFGFSEQTAATYGVTDYELVSIGKTGAPFFGKLNGISNATINVTGAYTGLIGTLELGEVSNITITGSMTLGDNEGAFANVMEHDSTLKNCNVNAVITSTSNKAGLVVGALNGGTIVDCVSTGENTTLGFVGTAATGTPAMVAVNEGASHYGTDYHEDGIITEDEIAKLTDITTEDKTHTKRNYVGLITGDCTYVINTKTENAVEGVTYYYAITGENSYQTEESAVGAFTQVNNLKLSDFGTTATGDWVRSGYYYTVSGSDKYYPLYKKVEVREVIPEPVAAIDAEDSTPAEGEGDGTTTPSESTTPTEPPKPVKYYTYHFRIPNGQGGYSDAYTFGETSDPESVKVALGIGAVQLATLYTLKNISSLSNGMYLFRSTDGNVLTAVPENVGSDTITKNMIWNYDGTNWINLEYTDSKITPAQVEISDTGSGSEMIVKVGTREYRIYKVEENTDREVKLVDQDFKYSTTDPSDDT